MGDELTENIRRWRERAKECREKAERMKDVRARRLLESIAEIYDKLLAREEKKLRGSQ